MSPEGPPVVIAPHPALLLCSNHISLSTTLSVLKPRYISLNIITPPPPFIAATEKRCVLVLVMMRYNAGFPHLSLSFSLSPEEEEEEEVRK